LRQFRLDELTDYYKNPRSLSEKEFKQLKTSLDKFGMIDKPIVNADSANTIIGGHQRKHVLEASGVKEIECWIPDRELSDKEVEELNIRLNKNTGSWDFDTLANEFELDDLLEWGFDKGELDLDLWADDAPEDVEPQIDKAEELRVKWGVTSGQLWQLGEHRLVCGDCTDRAVVDKVMGGERAELLLTDPPYNLGFDYGKNVDDRKITQDYKEFLQAFFSVWSDVSDKQIITPGKQNLNLWLDTDFIDVGCWYKKNAMSGSKIAHLNLWEPILFFGKFDRKSRPSDLFEYNVKQQEGVGGHPCPKIIDLWKDIIVHYSSSGARIADCFDGAGTTIVACEQTGRVAVVSELEPKYVAVAIQRWVDVTGGEPVLLGS